MKNTITVVIIVLLLILIGLFLYFYLTNKGENNVNNNVVEKLQDENNVPKFDFD